MYTATITPFKRLPLARKVESLRLITASHPRIAELPGLGLGHAVANDRYLNRAEVAAAVNECRVGLALSAAEGGMLACTEYLLCGLPVVSTPSVGGRDVWLDASNSRIVPPDADAVAAAVREFVAQPPDPEMLRADALRRVRFFRTALAEMVRRISGRMPYDPEAIDGSWFVRHFVAVHFLSDYLKSHTKGGFERSDLLGKFA